MSSTNRGADRNENDRYITPYYTVRSLLNNFDQQIAGSSFCEPCRGDGAIFNQIFAETKVFAEIEEGIDFLTTPLPADYAITNPPFSLAMEFLEKSLRECRSVYYLLRLNFLGSVKRKAFWNANPPSHVLVLSKRPSFTGHGTDSVEYAWFCWDKAGAVRLPAGVHVL